MRRSAMNMAGLDKAVANINAAHDGRAFLAAYHDFWVGVAAASGNALFGLPIPALAAIGRSGGLASTEDGRRRAHMLCNRIRSAIGACDCVAATRAVEDLHAMITEIITLRYSGRLPRTFSWADVREIL